MHLKTLGRTCKTYKRKIIRRRLIPLELFYNVLISTSSLPPFLTYRLII
jgi:hypothetical protein